MAKKTSTPAKKPSTPKMPMKDMPKKGMPMKGGNKKGC